MAQDKSVFQYYFLSNSWGINYCLAFPCEVDYLPQSHPVSSLPWVTGNQSFPHTYLFLFSTPMVSVQMEIFQEMTPLFSPQGHHQNLIYSLFTKEVRRPKALLCYASWSKCLPVLSPVKYNHHDHPYLFLYFGFAATDSCPHRECPNSVVSPFNCRVAINHDRRSLSTPSTCCPTALPTKEEKREDRKTGEGRKEGRKDRKKRERDLQVRKS